MTKREDLSVQARSELNDGLGRNDGMPVLVGWLN
jgi:hypothetical protein